MRKLITLLLVLVSFSVLSMKMSFHQKGSTTLQFGYIRFVPDNWDSTAKIPVVVFFHGVGERGSGNLSDLNRILNIALPKELKNGRQLDAVVICPQHYSGFYAFDRANLEANEVKPVLTYVRSLPTTDLNRVYVTGLSAGSNAVIHAAFYYPELITAAWAVAVKSAFTPYRKELNGFPFLLVSNEGDSPNELQGTITAIINVKGNLKTDIGPGTSHNSWDRAYSTQANYDWLFSQTKGAPTYIDVTSIYDPLIQALEAQLEQLKALRNRGKIYTKK